MRITRPGGTDLTVKLGEYPTMIQYGYSETRRPLRPLGRRPRPHLPERRLGQRHRGVRARRHRRAALLPLRAGRGAARHPRRLHPQDRGRARRQADERLARRQQGAARRHGRPRHLASRLGPQSAGALGRDRAQRRRSRAPPCRRALLCRQFPVLDRPELAGRRQAHHQGPLRRADARLHGDARQRRDHRARQVHRREDAGRASSPR